MAIDYSDGMLLARETEEAAKHDRCRPRFFMDQEDIRRDLPTPHGQPKQYGPLERVDVEMVEIEVPGDAKLKPVHKVGDEHRRRWPDQYKAFKSGQEQKLDGEAIEQWPALTRGQCERYRALGIRTVKDFAHLPDGAAHEVGPDFYKLRQAAQRRIQPESVTVTQMAEERAAQDRRIAELEARINQMAATQAVAPQPTPIIASTPAPLHQADLEDAPPMRPLPRKPPPKNQPR